MPEEPAGPVVKAADGAARITTFKTLTKDGHNPTLVPAITAGTLFTGVFSINISSTLRVLNLVCLITRSLVSLVLLINILRVHLYTKV